MKRNSYILVTGGAGYIGAHMSRILLEKGEKVVVFDNLSTGKRSWVPDGAIFEEGDLLNFAQIEAVFKKYSIRAVMDFAALIDVAESVASPIKYYGNNVVTLINLLFAMEKYDVRKIIFSSTAAVYGDSKVSPVTESVPVDPKSPYGFSKLVGERILMDAASSGRLNFIAFRYFNVAGFHPEWPLSAEYRSANHLIANIMKSANGEGELKVFGSDYPTPDGTCIRDFISSMDLCEAHWLALEAMNKGMENCIINLGSEKGFSILEIIKNTEDVVGRAIPYKIVNRRSGDIISSIASTSRAKDFLRWAPRVDIKTMLKTEWRVRNNRR